ncbi:MAG: hypothetical protein WBZ36_23350 [Candidatus Nitrosopolaris sp.]
MSADKDILTKQIGLGGFGYALRKENRILFEEISDRCKKKDYVNCAANKGQNFSAETLFLVLIFEQQKMINELIRKLVKVDRI